MNLEARTPDPERVYDGDGYRRVRPSERSPGLTELRLPTGRTIQCVGFGPTVDKHLQERASRG